MATTGTLKKKQPLLGPPRKGREGKADALENFGEIGEIGEIEVIGENEVIGVIGSLKRRVSIPVRICSCLAKKKLYKSTIYRVLM